MRFSIYNYQMLNIIIKRSYSGYMICIYFLIEILYIEFYMEFIMYQECFLEVKFVLYIGFSFSLKENFVKLVFIFS